MSTRPLFVAHDVGDLFNALPTIVGFVPHESVVAIATHGARHRFGFRMRVDLPGDASTADDVARFVVTHLHARGADGAIVLALSERTDLAATVVRAIEGELLHGIVPPVVTAWSDGARTWTTRPDQDPAGDPFVADPHHPSVVAAVVAGQEVLPDRAALEARWAPTTGERRAWLEASLDEVALDVAARVARLGPLRASVEGLQHVDDVLDDAHHGVAVDDGDLLRLCVWLSLHEVRDHVWEELPHLDPHEALAAWLPLARRAPAPFDAVPYTVAACAAYLAGDGAQASMGLDRALAADPGYAMARTLEAALASGIDPDRLRLGMIGRAAPSARP